MRRWWGSDWRGGDEGRAVGGCAWGEKGEEMTKQEFLARCANAWDTGRATPETLRILARWADMVCRLQGGQFGMFMLLAEIERERTGGFNKCLANDGAGYKAVEFTAILTHPCQRCAKDPKAWWTRAAFCDHKKPYTDGHGDED